MIRSGRSRSAVRTRSCSVTAPAPSAFAGLASSRTTWPARRNSAVSSTATTRSSAGISVERTFRRVVFPAPVPPLTTRFRLSATASASCRAPSSSTPPPCNKGNQVGDGGGEPAHRHHRPVHGDRRDDGMESAAVGETGIDHRRCLIEPEPERRQGSLHRSNNRIGPGESDGRRLELTPSLDPHRAVAVDENISDIRLAEEALDRSQPDQGVDHILNGARWRQRCLLGDQTPQLGGDRLLVQRHRGGDNPVDQTVDQIHGARHTGSQARTHRQRRSTTPRNNDPTTDGARWWEDRARAGHRCPEAGPLPDRRPFAIGCSAPGSSGTTGTTGTSTGGGWSGVARSTTAGQPAMRASRISAASSTVTPPLRSTATPLRDGLNSSRRGWRRTRSARVAPSPYAGPKGSRSITSAVPAEAARPSGAIDDNNRSVGHQVERAATHRTYVPEEPLPRSCQRDRSMA